MCLLALLLMLVAVFNAKGIEFSSPMSEVKNTMQKLKSIVGDPALKAESKKKERRQRLREVILEQIDVAEMGRRSLGSHWQNITDSERAEYLDVFGKYIESLYRKTVFESVEFINSTNIRYLKERIDGRFAEIEIAIPSSPEDTKVTFKLHIVSGKWKAYDVVIEGISQVLNLRSQFNRILNEKSSNPFQFLLKRLRDKITD
jgi:phospholipid transport system substrate-binding protein